VTDSGLRAVLALLLHEYQHPPPALRADAERTIGRRTATRWAGRAGALVIVGGLVTVAIAGAIDATRNDAPPGPSPSLAVELATFPFAGGPEFMPASASFRCGDPAPAAHHEASSLELTLVSAGDTQRDDPAGWGTSQPVVGEITRTAATRLGTVSTSGIDYLVVKRGVVVGMLDGAGPVLNLTLGNLEASTTLTYPLSTWVHCPGEPIEATEGVEPGAYEVIAVARVFSTPESVALSQAFGDAWSAWNLDPTHLDDDPSAVYLPGSWDCSQAITTEDPPRACLSDVTSQAVVDAEARTVSLFYDVDALAEGIDATLVSESLAVELVDPRATGVAAAFDFASLGVFDDQEDFACGATGWINMPVDGEYQVVPGLAGQSIGMSELGGSITGSIFIEGAPDGTLIELLPGARLIFLRQSEVDMPSSGGLQVAKVDTVMGSSSVAAEDGVLSDRFAGPQPVTYVASVATPCPDRDGPLLLRGTHIAFVGMWRVTTPDGTVSVVDSVVDTGFY